MIVIWDDPIGYFLTWTTYGTWLPGDSRGWVEHRHGLQLPDSVRKAEAAARMTDDACRLSEEHRFAVEDQVRETCGQREWPLHAVNCRSNHIHVVVSVHNTLPQKIRVDLKAWTVRCLKQRFDSDRDRWWSERGSMRYLNDEESLEAAIVYVLDGQDRKPEKRS